MVDQGAIMGIAETAMGIQSQGEMKRAFIDRLRELKRPEHEIELRERELQVLRSAYLHLRHVVETTGSSE